MHRSKRRTVIRILVKFKILATYMTISQINKEILQMSYKSNRIDWKETRTYLCMLLVLDPLGGVGTFYQVSPRASKNIIAIARIPCQGFC